MTFCSVDGPTRTLAVAAPMTLTGDVRADMDRVREIYAGARGLRPGRAGVPRLRAEDEGHGPAAEASAT